MAAMYLEHFGLTEPPFRITPHTDFFFSGANRGATLEALVYAVTSDEGIVKVSGEVGTGKTMLCRALMEKLPDNVSIVYLANPSLSREDILYAIAAELGVTLPEPARTSAVQRKLQEYLIEIYGSGRQVVVLIDEAHAMPAETLEEIRLLSNLESNRHKLLQLVMFGQPEINEVLARPDLRQLRERITHNFALEPLTKDEIAQYLAFRLRAAGHRGPEIFSPAAVKLLASASLGLTRRINILADKALLAAFAANRRQITPREVRVAIRDSEFGSVARQSHRQFLTAGAIGAGIALVLVAAVLIGWIGERQATPIDTPAVAPAAQAAPATRIETAQQGSEPPAAVTPPPAEPAAVPATPLRDWPELGPRTTAKVQASAAWLAQTDGERWFLQLARADVAQAAYVEGLIGKADELLDPTDIRAYAIRIKEGKRLGVIYGDFPTQAAAQAAAAELPSEIRQLNPYPRQVQRLR
ncbi:MAG: AAA family ATPase [Sterolibacteriaceae bacterium MAG5]|nr:AAA family ATPase [Candidatus Nitricoxidireducens bremensis]